MGFKDKLIFDSSLLDGNMLHEVQGKDFSAGFISTAETRIFFHSLFLIFSVSLVSPTDPWARLAVKELLN